MMMLSILGLRTKAVPGIEAGAICLFYAAVTAGWLGAIRPVLETKTGFEHTAAGSGPCEIIDSRFPVWTPSLRIALFGAVHDYAASLPMRMAVTYIRIHNYIETI